MYVEISSFNSQLSLESFTRSSFNGRREQMTCPLIKYTPFILQPKILLAPVKKYFDSISPSTMSNIPAMISFNFESTEDPNIFCCRTGKRKNGKPFRQPEK